MPHCMIVLPARLASTRLPEKLLKVAAGKTILQHTYEAACCSRLTDQVVVAVDNEKLSNEVENFGGRWVKTSTECQSGTDRVAEVASRFPDVELFVNVQADEPEIKRETIDRVVQSLMDCPEADIATAGTPITDENTIHDPSSVKIVLGGITQKENSTDSNSGLDLESGLRSEALSKQVMQGRAVYFSRAAIPYVRDGIQSEDFHRSPPIFWHHIGIYAYRRDFLTWFANAESSSLEQVEKLEQLRAIEAGKWIQVVEVDHRAAGIDTQKDFDQFVARISG